MRLYKSIRVFLLNQRSYHFYVNLSILCDTISVNLSICDNRHGMGWHQDGQISSKIVTKGPVGEIQLIRMILEPKIDEK